MSNGRRQPSRGGTSRMTRECQVRICERLGVKFPGPTRQSRQIDRPTTLVSCPLRADRVRNSAPQRIEALFPDPDSEHHSESPVSRNPIKASMRQSPQVSGSAPLTG